MLVPWGIGAIRLPHQVLGLTPEHWVIRIHLDSGVTRNFCVLPVVPLFVSYTISYENKVDYLALNAGPYCS
jgi:hypothetical protein